MSYEGSEEHLCENGHRWEIGCRYDWDDEGELTCPYAHCGKKSVWYHSIDDTNCDSVGTIPEEIWEKFLIAPVQTKECPTCHHKEVIELARYKIPATTREELARLEHYWDAVGNRWRKVGDYGR